MDLIGKEVEINVGILENGKKKRWRKGTVLKKYGNWYLVQIGEGERGYRMGMQRIEIKMPEEVKEEEEE